MPRREYRRIFKCAEPGCADTQFFVLGTRSEEADVCARQKRDPYRCSRHAHPEQNNDPTLCGHVVTLRGGRKTRNADLPGLPENTKGHQAHDRH